MNNLFKFFTFFLILFHSTVFGAKHISGSADFPLELNLTLEAINEYIPEYYRRNADALLDLDVNAQLIKKEDVFLIGKIEVYKALLKNNTTPLKGIIDINSINKLNKIATKTKEPFFKWILSALINDINELINSKQYKEFLLIRNSDNIQVNNYRRIEKKIELLQYWISIITPDSEENDIQIKKILAEKILNILKNVSSSFAFIVRESQIKLTQVNREHKYIKIEEKQKKNSNIEKSIKPTNIEEKSVEAILEPIISPNLNENLPKPSDENWVEDENAPEHLKNLPKPINDTEWLEDF